MMQNKKPVGFKATGFTVALGILALILLLLFGVWEYLQSKLDKINYVGDSGNQTEQTQPENMVSELGGQQYLNVLLLGTDERANDFSVDARSDCTMLISLDLKEHTGHLVSLERGIGVPIEGQEDDWLTHVFRYGGADLMLKTVREQFDVQVNRYVRVNFHSFAKIIDAIGGVDITLTETEAAALNGEIYTNATTKHTVYPGLNHLDGYDALQYARERFIDDDWHRIQRQQAVIQAALEQTKHLNLFQIDDLLDETLPLVQTNMTKKEISSLLPKAPLFLGMQLKKMTLPLPGTFGNKQTSDGRSLMQVDFEENTRILHEFLYGSFDPETYTVSETVKTRVAKAQRKAAIEWAQAHPQPVSSQEEPETDQGDKPSSSTKKKTSSSKASSKSSKSSSSQSADLDELKQALEEITEKNASTSDASSKNTASSKQEKLES